jgi:acyl carrier protein
MTSKQTTTVVADVPTNETVEKAIVTALAAAQGKPAAEIRVALVAAGPSMPIDSLEMVEIALELEDAFGIRFPDSAETCAAFQSVHTAVEFVRKLAAAAATPKEDTHE